MAKEPHNFLVVSMLPEGNGLNKLHEPHHNIFNLVKNNKKIIYNKIMFGFIVVGICFDKLN